MINLAGVEECDKHIRAELNEANIGINGERGTGEVPYFLIGELFGSNTFLEKKDNSLYFQKSLVLLGCRL